MKAGIPVAKSETDKRLEQSNQEHLKLLDARMQVLHPGKIGRHYPAMHVPLIPGKTVRMPNVDQKVLQALGYSTGITKSYDVDYLGAQTEEEFLHMKAKGLVTFPGLFFSIRGERK